MPNLNQTGPGNQGPMSDRGQGICRRTDSPTSQRTNEFQCRAAGGTGRRMGRAGRRSMGGEWSQPGPGPEVDTPNALKNRAQILEAELNAVKQQLKDQAAPNSNI